MKINRLLISVFSFILLYNTAIAQPELCKNAYVWEFSNHKGERDGTTRLLSNDVEDILSQYQECTVLQRSRFTRLLEQINTEKAIQSLNSATQQVKTELNAIKAKFVVFGEVSRDFQGNVALRLSFENLETTKIKSNTVYLTGDDYHNFGKRKQKLERFIDSFIDLDNSILRNHKSPQKEITKCSLNMKLTGPVKYIDTPFLIKNIIKSDTIYESTFYFTINHNMVINELIICPKDEKIKLILIEYRGGYSSKNINKKPCFIMTQVTKGEYIARVFSDEKLDSHENKLQFIWNEIEI